MGRGVFTSKPIEKDTTIEISPVIVMNSDARKLIDQTLLHDYIFEWGQNRDECCMALGYVRCTITRTKAIVNMKWITISKSSVLKQFAT